MTNTELAWRIHDGLKQAGIDIGAASVELVKLLIDDAEAERWIPVSECLPEKSDEYLIVIRRSDGLYGSWVWLKSFDPDAGKFLISGEQYFIVTHWQPVPEAPESEAAE